MDGLLNLPVRRDVMHKETHEAFTLCSISDGKPCLMNVASRRACEVEMKDLTEYEPSFKILASMLKDRLLRVIARFSSPMDFGLGIVNITFTEVKKDELLSLKKGEMLYVYNTGAELNTFLSKIPQAMACVYFDGVQYTVIDLGQTKDWLWISI